MRPQFVVEPPVPAGTEQKSIVVCQQCRDGVGILHFERLPVGIGYADAVMRTRGIVVGKQTFVQARGMDSSHRPDRVAARIHEPNLPGVREITPHRDHPPAIHVDPVRPQNADWICSLTMNEVANGLKT